MHINLTNSNNHISITNSNKFKINDFLVGLNSIVLSSILLTKTNIASSTFHQKVLDNSISYDFVRELLVKSLDFVILGNMLELLIVCSVTKTLWLLEHDRMDTGWTASVVVYYCIEQLCHTYNSGSMPHAIVPHLQ